MSEIVFWESGNTKLKILLKVATSLCVDLIVFSDFLNNFRLNTTVKQKHPERKIKFNKKCTKIL